MRKLKGITINGEWLGDNIAININFRAICSFAPFVMQEFAKIINSFDNIHSKIVINNFYFPDSNSINIGFNNNDFEGEILLCYRLKKEIPEIVDKKITIYKENIEFDDDIEEIFEDEKNDSSVNNISEKSIEEKQNEINEKTNTDNNVNVQDKANIKIIEQSEELPNHKADKTRVNDNQNFSHKLPKRKSNIVKCANIREVTYTVDNKNTEEIESIIKTEQHKFYINNNSATKNISKIEQTEELTKNNVNSVFRTTNDANEIDNIDYVKTLNTEFDTKLPVEAIEKNNSAKENIRNFNDNNDILIQHSSLKTDKIQNIVKQELEENIDIKKSSAISNEKEENSAIIAMLDEILVLREELNKLKSEKITIDNMFNDKEKFKNIIEDENADFRIMGSQKRLNANILDEDLFIAGNRLYRWGDTLYLEE